MITGIRQADLARMVGISASYLNLIEHNRRRIGGKLLLDIAAALNVEPQVITEGAEAALIAALGEAAEASGIAEEEAGRVQEFAGRFPGWAEALAKAHARIHALERTVETLSDRLSHDPQLAASLHEVLSSAAAIRATASILDETTDLAPQIRDRFQSNLHQDSERLSESAKFLVGFLEADAEMQASGLSAQEDVENWFAEMGHAFPTLETTGPDPEAVDALLAVAAFEGAGARDLGHMLLTQINDDARRVPLERLGQAVDTLGYDPAALAAHYDVPVSLMLRRLALLPAPEVGLVVADRAGSLIFRKPIEGFATPRFGTSCTLWPVFQALTQPGMLVRTHLMQWGQKRTGFEAFAIAEPVVRHRYNTLPLYRSTMLLRPLGAADKPAETDNVGVTCRICPQGACPGRREPSILSKDAAAR